MKSGLLVYKCRRCGEEVKDTHVPDSTLALLSILRGWDLPKEWGAIIPQTTDIHECKDKNLGVCDLIGCELDKPE